MPPCNCGKSKVQYEVKAPGMAPKTVASMSLARGVLQAAGNPRGASVTPVKPS